MSFSIVDLSRPSPPSEHPARKAEKAAADFEGILLASVMESLAKTFAGASDATPGMQDYSYMGSQALASAVAAHGGIGIARLILRQWRDAKTLEAPLPRFVPPS
jgi:Rod binding domain-containing protein